MKPWQIPLESFGRFSPSAKVESHGQLTDNNLMERMRLAWLIGYWIVAFSPCPLASGVPPAAAHDPSSSQSQDLLHPIVCRFNFEDVDAAPNSLPHHFVRNISPWQGFPNFGSMRLANDVAYSGSGSFLFELAGGSMSASVPTSIIPILPLADYQVSAKVRTQGLTNAGVRLVAWLHNTSGQAIPASRVQSAVIRAMDRWESLMVTIKGDFADAADLVLELQIVQPEHHDVQAMLNDEPRPQDVTGRAWFDDVTVVHMPRVSLTLPQPGNIVHWPAQPTFEIRVSELSSQQLTARLRVFDIDDFQIFDHSFPAPRGRQAGTIPVKLDRFGWYRAVLEVIGSQSELQTHELAFAYLPRPLRRTTEPSRFGVLLHDMPIQQTLTVSALTTEIGCGFAAVPVWHADTGSKRDQQRQIAMRELIERLMQADVDLIFCMQQIPDRLAVTLGLEPNQVASLLSKDAKLWRPYLDELLVNFGLEVRRWLIGSPLNDVHESEPDMKAGISAAFHTLSEFVPDPQLLACQSFEHSTLAEAGASASPLPLVLAAPYHVSPGAIEDYLAMWNASPREYIVFLNQLPETHYSPRERTVDFMHRVLHAWRSSAKPLMIEAPWNAQSGSGDSIMPDPAFCAWRTLAEQLNGRTVAGELPLSPGAHCWLLKGVNPQDSALVAWCDHDGDGPSTLLRTQLAHGGVEVLDAFGNRTVFEPIAAQHTIPLTQTPLYITNVDLDLVQFRGSMAISPSFMPAVPKMHEHELLLKNPWETPLSGTVRLSTTDPLTITPATQDFSIPPHGEIRLPLQIIPDRGIVGGRKRISAEILIQAERKRSLQVDLDLEVGLRNIDMTATWTTSRNPMTGIEDLVVSAAVTNKGDQRSTLDVYLLADGVGQNRRTIAALGSGETAVRTFRISNGAALLAGRQVRVGVAERDGLTRLNQVLTIASP